MRTQSGLARSILTWRKRSLRTTPRPTRRAELFGRVKPRLAVYSHAPNTESVMAQARKACAGRLEGPEDMLTIEIGEQIAVRHFAH